MTLSVSYSPDTYAGNGSLDTFAITFPFLSDGTNVKVSLKNDTTGALTLQTVVTHYNVVDSDVVFVTPPASGITVLLERETDFKQESDYRENDEFPAEVLEADLDQLKMEVQTLKNAVDRSFKFDAELDLSAVDMDAHVLTADYVLAINSAGTGIELIEFNAGSFTASSTDTLTNKTINTASNTITIVEADISDLGSYITSVAADTTPQLGGNLDVDGNKIVSTSGGNIDIEPNGTGNVLLGNFTFDADQTVGAGQDDYVLTYDNGTGVISLEAAAGGGGSSALVFISSGTASNDATLDFDNVITSTYDDYLIVVSGLVPATDGDALRFRVGTGAGPTYDTGSNYKDATTSRDHIQINTSSSTGNDTGEHVSARMMGFQLPSSALYKTFRTEVGFWGTAASMDSASDSEGYVSTTAVTSLRFYFAAGNITSGTVRIYGYAKS